MASIRSAQQSDIAQMKDYYLQRETEIQNKHHSEISSLRQQQGQELDKVRGTSQQAVDGSRERMKEKLTEMDQKHQKDIENLKALYQKKLEKYEKS